MAGALSTFFPRRPGVEQGRIQPQGTEPGDGSHVLGLGSDVAGRFVLAEIGDYIEYVQTAARDTGRLLRAGGFLRGPATMPVVTEAGPFVLADGDELVLQNRTDDISLVFLAEDFVDIGTATAVEVAQAVNAQSDVVAARYSGGQIARMDAVGGGRLRVAGGAAAAKIGATELAWLLDVVVDGSRLAVLHVEPGRSRELDDLAANLSAMPADVEIRLRLRLDRFGVQAVNEIFDATALVTELNTTFTADGYRKVIFTFPNTISGVTWNNTLFTSDTTYSVIQDGSLPNSAQFSETRADGSVLIRRNSASGTLTVTVTAHF